MLPRLTSVSIYEDDRSIRPHGVVQAIAGSIIDPTCAQDRYRVSVKRVESGACLQGGGLRERRR